ncbi:MAG: aconitate hydratase, partial [Planctomycetes bacterium]|nr:aconitate hydratase [Planctomycetota bacterium]
PHSPPYQGGARGGDGARQVELVKGPNIATLPDFDPLPAELELPVLLKPHDDISTDEILPAGTRVLPYRSNIPAISRFAFEIVDETYAERASEVRDAGGHAIVGGENYGQGSSREHAALAPRYLGLRAVIAKSFARIHWQNLINFGILPLEFVDTNDAENIEASDRLRLTGLDRLGEKRELTVENVSKDKCIRVKHRLSPRQVAVLSAGGLINWVRERDAGDA